MPTVAFTQNLEKHLACPAGQVSGTTVREVLDSVFADHPRLRSYILDEQDRLRKHVTIFVDSQAIGDRLQLSDPVAEAAEVFVMQALSGG